MDLILILCIVFIPLIAQIYVSSSYNKFSKVKNKLNISGFEVARKILDKNGLNDVHIVETRGNLTDHYDPTRKVVRLSSSIFHGESIAALSVAAHEVGHAIQDKEGYLFLKFRSFIFPIVNFASRISYIVILIGFFMELMQLVWLGILLVGLGVIFQLVTLPVEFNASKRALKELNELKLCDKEDSEGVESMLKSAAYTYVAGVLASILQLLRLTLMARDD